MATALMQSETISFDQNIFTVINDLKKKQKWADIDSIHMEIIKTIDFKDITKDDLQDRVNIPLINEKLINKINRNLNSPTLLMKLILQRHSTPLPPPLPHFLQPLDFFATTLKN